HGQHRRIEPLCVPDLQNPRIAAGRLQQGIRFRQAAGHGLFDQHIDAHLHQTAPYFRMRHRWHGHGGRIHGPAQLLHTVERASRKFLRYRRRARSIPVEDPGQLHALHFAIHPHVVPAELSRSHYRYANFPRVSRLAAVPTHSLFIPSEPRLGSATWSGEKACMAIPAASASSISLERSKSSVRAASMANAVAPVRFMVSTVGSPTTGTSKRISCPGLLTFTTTIGRPFANRA